MIRERLRESRDLNRMQTRQFIAGRLQLNRSCISREITDVSPVDDFHRLSGAYQTGWRESPPKSLQTYVCSRHSPLAGRFNDLHIVDSHDSLAIDIDQLLVEHVASEQHLTFAPHKGTQVENV